MIASHPSTICGLKPLAVAFALLLLVFFINFIRFSDNESNRNLSFLCKSNSNSTNFIGCVICNEESNKHNSILFKSVILHNLRDFSLRRTVNTTHVVPIPSIEDSKAVFANIYNSQVWTPAGGGSGVGSDEGFAVSAIHILQLVILRYGVTRMLDAPCGGVHSSWMNTTLKKVKETIPCFLYMGVDVVSSVISKNRESFNQHSNWVHFSEMDLSIFEQKSISNVLNHRNKSNEISSLPKGFFQMILSRDALQHLSYAAITGALHHYCSTNADWLLVGSYLLHSPDGISKNKNINTGETFSINLLEPPFNFQNTVEIFPERSIGQYSDAQPENAKFLLLFRLPQLCESKSLQSFVETYRPKT
mmetsp:Transcript_29328/g.41838  ORF Transcript_29328/g.41838 Transcript_29328/m.41838 type:complete len:361 (+) Transcript_29328:9-1091(+)